MNRLPTLFFFTLIWIAITGRATLHNAALGLAVSAFALWFVRHKRQPQLMKVRPLKVLSLFRLFLVELAFSAFAVAVTVMKPRLPIAPGFFAFPLTVDRDFEITLLANLITLTPGTLSVDVSEDRKLLFVHALDCRDVEAVRRSIAEGFERRIMEAFR